MQLTNQQHNQLYSRLSHALFAVVLFCCLSPLIPGFIGLFSSGMHYIPALGFTQINFDGFKQVFEWHGVYQSLFLSFSTALISCILAIAICFFTIKNSWLSKRWQTIQLTLSPLLALPHVAYAIGFLLLLSPTGLFARLLSPIIQIDTPWLVQDSLGLGLILSLTMKEVPFLLLIASSVLNQIPIKAHMQAGASLGLSQNQVWWQVILPQWLPKMRFAIFSVLAYACSVVDMSLILAPTTPPPFAVLVWQWFNETDLNLFPRAAAGALTLFLLCIALLWLYKTFEQFFISNKRHWIYTPKRWFLNANTGLYRFIFLFSLCCIVILILWSFTQRWQFPDLLPTQWSLNSWQDEWFYLKETLSTSILIALLSATIATIFALFAQEYRLKYPNYLPMIFVALPMLLPQISILFGIQVFVLYIGEGNYLFWVIWAHLFFAFPYIYLALDGPWKSYPTRFDTIGSSLGLSPLHVWLKIKIPQLLPSILTAWAIGISVSLAQYLSTLMLGAGRISTLTTEAVALVSGYDRRLMALYALWQALIPLFFFTAVFLINKAYSKKFRTSPINPSSVIKKTQVLHELKTK